MEVYKWENNCEHMKSIHHNVKYGNYNFVKVLIQERRERFQVNVSRRRKLLFCKWY